MKRTFICMLLMTAATGALFAQAPGPDFDFRQDRRFNPGNTETSTITGKLELINGTIAVKNDDTVYYIAGLGRLIGFVDGLKEGAEVSLEGWTIGAPGTPEYQRFLVSKLTLNGKEYTDLSPWPGPMMGPPAIARGDDFGAGGKFHGPHCFGMDRNRDSRHGRWR
jgi:hypothetical protein